MTRLRAVSLFSGIGGFDIALEAHGVEVVAGCDIEPFVAGIFEQRFGVPVIPDIAEGTADHPTPAADHWPTPQASDGTGGRNEMGAIRRQADGEKLQRPSGAKVTIPLGSAVRAVEEGLWPTPKASPSGPDYARADREDSGGDDLATAAARTQKGQLNPRWVEWLMGFPLGWTDPECANEDLEFWPWSLEPLPRVAEGVPLRRQRLTALGNALVWQVAAVVVGKALRG